MTAPSPCSTMRRPSPSTRPTRPSPSCPTAWAPARRRRPVPPGPPPFQNGKVGVMPYPATSVSALFKTSKFEIGVTPIPGVSGGSSTFLGGDAIGISKDCKKPAQAWNFLAWLMTQKAQQSVFADNNDTASNLKVLESGYTKADPRTQIANMTVRTGQTPIATNFNEAFNASGSPWQLLIQDAVWGDASKVAKDNTAITTALAG
ncbi:extracellular solute-binding protein [Acidipropionibacterium acidipropionici]|uniref:extracellular solute-binding protein n=2 Tax=Acidipropionibacterium acidipropionici TaxID=1748 RepID=UPI0030B91424